MSKDKSTFPDTIYVSVEEVGTEDQYLLASDSVKDIGLELRDKKRVGVYKLIGLKDLVSDVQEHHVAE